MTGCARPLLAGNRRRNREDPIERQDEEKILLGVSRRPLPASGNEARPRCAEQSPTLCHRGCQVIVWTAKFASSPKPPQVVDRRESFSNRLGIHVVSPEGPQNLR